MFLSRPIVKSSVIDNVNNPYLESRFFADAFATSFINAISENAKLAKVSILEIEGEFGDSQYVVSL